ncbi:MAG TPA: class I SAM-dependent methyltransferase [Burkholderiaceae bacterium]|nr:class I SAM-dependent methyltransferase [Burkholderiaceae bacterium]
MTHTPTLPPESHWNAVYRRKRADEVSWYQPHAERSLALIEAIAAGRPARVIDVGGGASTLVDDLLARPGLDVTVLDIAPAALAVAQARLGPLAARVHWRVGDVTAIDLPAQAYDLWHDRAVFHFLTDPAQRAAYVAQVRRAVRPGGHVIVAAFAPDGPTQCSGLPVVRYAPHELHAQFGGAFELVEHLDEVHRTPAGAVQHFVYCHCVLH